MQAEPLAESKVSDEHPEMGPEEPGAVLIFTFPVLHLLRLGSIFCGHSCNGNLPLR